jgi:glucose dehydrogenase
VAAGYVSFGRSLIANSIWSISNIGFIWYNISVGESEMILLFGVYELTALYGVYNLGIKPYLEKRNENTT